MLSLTDEQYTLILDIVQHTDQSLFLEIDGKSLSLLNGEKVRQISDIISLEMLENGIDEDDNFNVYGLQLETILGKIDFKDE